MVNMTQPLSRFAASARFSSVVALSILAFACSSTEQSSPNYLIGSGIGDITSPLVDVPFELLNMSHEIGLSVVDNLQAKHGGLYSLDNVVLSATHTHSSPAGYSHDGTFREAYFDAVVQGITDAIESAHESMQPGRILLGQREVEAAGANRSAIAYAQNPEAERARYLDDTDKEMTLLKLEGEDGIIGALSWFAVHPTSLTYNNFLVSADHKGIASFEMERRARMRSGTTPQFIAAFAQNNCGDVTGNLNLDNAGPGVGDYDGARISGERQLDVAMALLGSASEPLRGGVDYRLDAVDFTALEVDDAFTGAGPQKTCFPAYGYDFAGSSQSCSYRARLPPCRGAGCATPSEPCWAPRPSTS